MTVSAEEECVVEILFDLKHDLGKYLVLPLRLLPEEASLDEIRRALHSGLYETRRANGKTLTARNVWRRYRQALAPWHEADWWASLERTVEETLSMEQQFPETFSDRDDLLFRMSRVEQVLRELLRALKNEQ